jgi:hypothetical protein
MNLDKFKVICARGIVAAAITRGLFASAQSVIVTVPFDFSAGDQVFPVGTYQFTSLSAWSLSIRNVKSGGEKFFTVRPQQNGSRASRSSIVFHNSKGQKILEAVYVPESDMGAELLPHADASPKLRSLVQNATIR